MKTFKNYLLEIYRANDIDRSMDISDETMGAMITDYDSYELPTNAKLIGTVDGKYNVYLITVHDDVLLFVLTTKDGDTIGQVGMDPYKDTKVDTKTGFHRAYQITLTHVDPQHAGQQLGPKMYELLIDKMPFTIISSSTQTKGGTGVWSKLMNRDNVNVRHFLDTGIGLNDPNTPKRSFDKIKDIDDMIYDPSDDTRNDHDNYDKVFMAFPKTKK